MVFQRPGVPSTLQFWCWIAALAGVVVLFSLLYWKRGSHPSPTTIGNHSTQDQGLMLHLENENNLFQGATLKLTWNREAQAIREADYGTLSIIDGDAKQEIYLGREELRNGSVNYFPLSKEITFRFQLTGGNSPLATTIRSTLKAESEPAGGGPGSGLAKTSRQPVRGPASDASVSEPSRGHATIEMNETREPIQNATPATQPAILEPDTAPVLPYSQALGNGKGSSRKADNPANQKDFSSERGSTYTVRVEALTPSRFRKLFHRVSPGHLLHLRGLESRFEPPRVLRQSRLVLSIEPLRSLRNPISVDVNVSVNRVGRVARVSSNTKKVPRPLATAALSAARQWLFAPARMGTTPVDSQVVLHFRFHNPDTGV